MTIRVKYFLFVLIVHGLITYLVFLQLREQKALFILSEILILISLVLSYQIYDGFVKPLRFIANGISALEDQDFSVRYQLTNSKELNQLISVYNSLIDNIREERVQLQEQHYFLQHLIQAYPAAVIILDFDEQIADFNPKAEDIFGKEKGKVIGRNLSVLQHDLVPVIENLEPGKAQLVKINGTAHYKCEAARFLHRGFYRNFILIHEVSREILHAEKQAYGKVIRMMAHEVNNSIGATNSILDTVQQYLSDAPSSEDAEMAEALRLAIDRHNNLNQFMRNFAEVVRLPAPQLEWVELPALLKEVVELMRPSLQAQQIQIVTDFSGILSLRKRLDKKQMEQALVNILKNAKEAMTDKGMIKIILKNNPIEILIVDNGHGISPEVQEQLFSPFFSTKTHGQGVGLTLVREIVLQHGANIKLETREDGWTYCIISF